MAHSVWTGGSRYTGQAALPHKNIHVSINIEASELLEIFQWTNKKTEPSPEMMERIKEELADVLIYSIDLANAYGIDMTQMIMNKLVKNAEKYPAK